MEILPLLLIEWSIIFIILQCSGEIHSFKLLKLELDLDWI